MPLARLPRFFGALCVCLASACISVDAGASQVPHLSGVHVLQGSQYKFADPFEIYAVAGRLWITNGGTNQLTVISASTGSVYKVLNPGPYHLWLGGVPLAVAGNDIWTLGYKTGYLLNLLVELNGSTGAVIRAINVGTKYNLNSAHAMIVSGSEMWLGTNTLTEFNLLTGRVVRSISSHVFLPEAIAVAHGDVWEFNAAGGVTLSEFATSSGKFQRSISLPGTPSSYGGYPPMNMVIVGNDLWLPAGSQAFKISTVTGKVLTRLNKPSYGIGKAMWVVALSNRVWFVNLQANSVTELNQSSAALVHVDKGSPYNFENPQAAAVIDGSVWVTNSYQFQSPPTNGGSITVLPAT